MWTPPVSDRTLAWVVLGLFAVGLLFVGLGPHVLGDSFAETDFYGGYVEGARLLREGRIEPSRYGVVGPGYEVALALASFVVPDLLTAAELLSAIVAVVGIACWILIVLRRGSPRLALVMALFLATNATLFRYGYSATNDTLAFALEAAAMLALLTSRRPGGALAAGALAAFAFLTRYPAGILVPVGVVAIVAGGTLQTRRRLGALLFLAGFAIPVVPWVVFSLTHGGGFAMQFHHNIAFDVYARPRGIPWDDYQEFLQPQFRSLFDVLARDPWEVLRHQAFNVFDHLRLDATVVVGLPVATCALLGAWIAAREEEGRRFWPIALMAALHFLVLVPFFHSARYAIPLLPFYALLAAMLFTPDGSRRLWGRFPAAAWIALSACLAWSTVSLIRETRAALDHLPREALAAARVLRQIASPTDHVICRKAHVAFHAQIGAVAFPFTRTLPELADYARSHRARWLYMSRFEAGLRPSYLYLLDTTVSIPGLERRSISLGSPSILYEIGPEFGQVTPQLTDATLLTLHAMRAKLWLDPSDLTAMLRLSEYDLIQGNAATARPRLEQAVSIHPRSAEAWTLLGHVLLELENPQPATAAYRRALELSPESLVARLGLGWARRGVHDLAGAAEAWRPVVGATQDLATLQQMAAVFRALGDSLAERKVLERLTGSSVP